MDGKKILTLVIPMLPTFSLDALIPEPMPKRPANMEVIPWTPIPLFITLT